MKPSRNVSFRVKIPSALGYGASPQPGSPIPPNANLEFDVHVVQVVPNAALMQGMQQGMPQGVPKGAPEGQAAPEGAVPSPQP
jgi:FKBP-type peptidyl-prolyl cis-trans isomerase FkpA